MRRRRPSTLKFVLALAGATAAIALPAGAQSTLPAPAVPTGSGNLPDLGGTPQTSDQTAAQGTPDQGNTSIQSSLGPYGDPGGLRASLAQRGVTYSLVFIGETLGNPSGGARQGIIGEGRLDLQVNVDLAKAIALDGATLHANGYKIFGDGLSRNDLLNLSFASGIEGLPSTRLYEVWFEQVAMGGKVALKLGQIGADTEFLASQYAALFVNSTFGWPNITGYDLPSGGPAYPVATPGIRLKLAPNDRLTVLAGVFDGDPAGAAKVGATAEPGKLDRYGTNFRVTDPPFVIAEAAYTYGGRDGTLLPGIAKLGGWENFGSFAATIPTGAGLSLGSGTGRLRGNDGLYGLVDQMVYRVPGVDDGAVGVFARLSGSPGDRNLISFYADAGITGKGLVPGRADDTAGVSFAASRISSAARRTDRLERASLGVPYPIRSNELLFEASYQAQVVPGFTLQPDIQYVVRPGGGIPNPDGTDFRRIRNAAVVGVRATVQY
ncbi:carbohydrate porin [Lichenibacterium minor]|uniref:Carbohydrate porin n=1 Tax=Lichenibacterium minor TaxID=2316528 RepID=A0A4Q2UCH3_9HYPH|nr:carbohydrate porin [Lichenibacterium minor]RYC32806.1 carbohydrate porin [Lichenibacterium minor]